MQSVKNLLSNTLSSQQDPYLAILESSNIAVDGLAIPAQLLMSRILRSTIPSLPQHFKPKIIEAQVFRENQEKIKQRQKFYHYEHSQSLPTLVKGEHIRMTERKKWKPAKVTRKANEPRSYIVQTPEGRSYRRNRSQLLQAKGQNSWPLEDTKEEFEESEEIADKEVRETSEQSKDTNRHYITRSGRVSKPPQRFSSS